MAGGSLPRGGKSAYFRRLSELVPPEIRTRVTQFIEQVAYKDELTAALAALEGSVETTVAAPHDHSSLYALIDHSHSEYSTIGHTHNFSADVDIDNIEGIELSILEFGDILSVSDFGTFVNGPPWFRDDLFSVYNQFDSTKTIRFDLDGLTTAALRTITPADADMTMFSTVNHDDLTDGGLTYLHTHDHDYLYGAGYYTHYEIDMDWPDLTDGGDTILHKHDTLYYQKPETVAVVSYICDGTSAPVTVYLPSAAISTGHIYNVKAINIDNAVTLIPNGTDEIDGVNAGITLSLMQSISVQSDGSNWWILDVLDHLRMANIGTNTHDQIDSHIADVLTNPHNVVASQVTFDELGTPTYNSVQDFVNQAWSSGLVAGLEMTDGGSYKVAVAAGAGCVASADDPNARTIYTFNFAGALSDVIADGTTRWVAIEYNAGTPQIVLGATADLDRYDAFPLGWVTREGTTLHITNAPQHAGQLPHRIGHTLREVWGFRRADSIGGIIIGNTGTRNPTLSAGEIYYGLNEFEIDAVDCSGADTFTRYYRVAGVWTKATGQTQWPNDTYTDGTNLQTMTNNRYGNVWWYVDLEDGRLIMLYGTANEPTQSAAEAKPPPGTVPERVLRGAVLVGRFVYQKGSAAPLLVQSVFNAAFNAAGVSDHLALANIGTNTHAQIDTFISTTVPGTYLPLSGGTVTGDILASPTATQDLGSPSFKWQSLYVGGVLADSVAVGGVAVATTDDLAGYLQLAGGTMVGNLEIEDGSLATQHNFASVSGDVDLCQQGGQVTIGGSGGTQTLTVVGGAIGVDNGWAFRGKTAGGTYVDFLKVESGGYRCIMGVTGARTKIVSNDSALLPFPTSAVSDANHDTKTWTVWVDESAHTLNFKVKYSTGTVKSGSIALA